MADSGLVSFQLHTHDMHRFVSYTDKNNYTPELTTQKPENLIKIIGKGYIKIY